MCSKLCFLFFVCFLCVVFSNAYSENSAKSESLPMNGLERTLELLGLSQLTKVYHKCKGKNANVSLEECLSVQMVVLMDQIVHKNAIPITDGIKFVEKPKSQGRSFSDNQVLTEEHLETALPRSLGDRQSVLDGLMLDKLSSFLDSFTMNVNLPDARALRRGGMKMKKMLLPFLMGVVLKTASIVPVVLSIMGVLAVKALLLSKGALILTALLGFRKLFHNGGHHGAQQKHHMLSHDMGLSGIGHGLANLMHNMGGGYEHHYAHAQPAESHGVATLGADAIYGRSFNDILKTSAIKKPTMAQRFVTTELPRSLQN